MKLKNILFALMMVCCLNLFGQQSNSTTSNNQSLQKSSQTSQVTTAQSQSELIRLERENNALQDENQILLRRLEKVEKDMNVCREDVR